MKKLMLAVAVLLVMVFALCACAPAEQAASPAAESADAASAGSEGSAAADQTDGKKLKFCFAVKNLTNPYFLEEARGVEETCKELGIEIDVQATNKDTEIDKQIQILDNFLSQKPDAIIAAPLSSTAIVPFIQRCNEAGVPFVNIDTAADETEMENMGAESVTCVITDNYAAGEECAKALIEALDGKGKIAVLEGTAGAQTAEERKSGFLSVMEKDGSGIEIVASQPANYNRNEGYTVFQSILAAHPDITGLFAANDEMALGAISAIEEAGMTGKNSVVGINFAADAQEAIKEGKMLGSVNQDPYTLGKLGVEKAYAYLQGEEVDDLYMTPSVMMYQDDIK